jgi:hypothetical protein
MALIGSSTAEVDAWQQAPPTASAAQFDSAPTIPVSVSGFNGTVAVNEDTLNQAAKVLEVRNQRAASRAKERRAIAERERCWDGDASDFNSTKKQYYKYIYRACELAEGQPWADENFTEQMDALISLWDRESGWNPTLKNAEGSSAYGIPQALPGSKMGKGWQKDPDVQIKWGLKYITSRYGTPINAWAEFNEKGWY